MSVPPGLRHKFLWLVFSAMASPYWFCVAFGTEARVYTMNPAALRVLWLQGRGCYRPCRKVLPRTVRSCSIWELQLKDSQSYFLEFPSSSLCWSAERLRNFCFCSMDKVTEAKGTVADVPVCHNQCHVKSLMLMTLVVVLPGWAAELYHNHSFTPPVQKKRGRK